MKKLILLLTQLFCHHNYQYTEINHDGLNTMECKWCGKKKVVKVLSLLVLAFVMCGCVYRVGDTSIGKKMAVPIENGSTRLTITTDYIIVETCEKSNNFKNPYWKCDKIMNNDSIRQELIHKIKGQ